MPPKTDDAADAAAAAAQITGRCYCGQSSITAAAPPLTTAYCHCIDCRRWTGGPVGVFAAFAPDAVTLTPEPRPLKAAPGVRRWACPNCGSPLAAQFDYLPEQTYVPIGILDQASDIRPQIHCHTGSRLPWLDIRDDLHRADASGRAALKGA